LQLKNHWKFCIIYLYEYHVFIDSLQANLSMSIILLILGNCHKNIDFLRVETTLQIWFINLHIQHWILVAFCTNFGRYQSYPKKIVQKRKLRANLLKTKITTSQGAKGSFDIVWKTTKKQALTMLPGTTRSSFVVVFSSYKVLKKFPHIHAHAPPNKNPTIIVKTLLCLV
jgi:hypothetical protein